MLYHCTHVGNKLLHSQILLSYHCLSQIVAAKRRVTVVFMSGTNAVEYFWCCLLHLGATVLPITHFEYLSDA